MKNENDILMMSDIISYSGYTTIGDESSRWQKSFTITLRKIVNDIRNKTFDKIIENSDNLQGEGVKIIVSSNNIDIYTKLEILSGLKLSGQTDTLTEASNLIDELYKRGDLQNEQQYRNALHKFYTQ